MSNKQDDMVEAFRLAIRQQGPMINAYIAQSDSMEGAKFIGSIQTGLCEMDRSLFDGFKHLMYEAAQALTLHAFGQLPELVERPAPEHEKAGHA